MRTNLLFLFSILIAIPFGSPAAFSSKGGSEATTEVTSEPAVGSVEDAMKEFKSLSRHERKERINQAKKELKKYKMDKRRVQSLLLIHYDLLYWLY